MNNFPSVHDDVVQVTKVKRHPKLTFVAVWGPMKRSGYGGMNGYVVFPKRPVREKGYHGIMDHIPVHGGLTYAEQNDCGMVYGFDTAHFDSYKVPREDVDWIIAECTRMGLAIKMARWFEPLYILAGLLKNRKMQNRARGFILDLYSKTLTFVYGDVFNRELTFSAMLNLLGGRL